MNRLFYIVVIAGIMLSTSAWAQQGWFGPTDPVFADLEKNHNVESEFVTPHTPWGRPWAGGSARVLFFVNSRGTAAREVIELQQRFDIEPEMVSWGRLVDTSRDDWLGGELGLKRLDMLLEQQWDAFVFLGIRLDNLPSEQQFVLLDAVTKGAGLVLSGLDDARVLKDANRLDPLPAALAAGPVGEAFSIREGRGLRMRAQPSITYAPGWEVRYDYWAQQLGRGILWAAGKEPQMELTLSQQAPEVAIADLPGNEVTIRWQAPAESRNLSFDIKLRRGDGWEQNFPPVTPDGATGTAVVQVPVVRADEYYVDVIARSDRGVENFASAAFTVTSPRRVSEVTLDSPWSEVGGELTGKVALEGAVEGENERLVVSLFDAHGRELKREISTPAADEGTFRFTVDAWLPMLVTVRATLVRGTQELASAWSFANVTKRNRGRFNFLMWDVPTGTLAPYAEESLARTGVSLQLGGGGSKPPPYVAANNIAWVPYTVHIATKKDEDGIMEPACWNDEEAIQAYVDEIVEKNLEVSHHGVFAYSLGDEIAVRGSCASPHCLAAYQRYLQEQYGTIQALNASWDTDFGSFDEIQLSKPDDDGETESLQSGNFPRWFDRQAFQSYNFCKLCERFGEAFQQMDSQALWGFEGAGRFRDGDDLDGFVRSNTFWAPYPGIADEVLRSIAPRDFPRANWMGYTKDADSLLQQYWRMVTRGSDSVWWWRWEVVGRFHGWLAPSFDPYPAVQEILRDTQIMREGLGDLLIQSEMLDDGIGMLFSHPSSYATRVQHSPSYGNYECEHNAWHNAVREWGMNFRYFTDHQMRLGEAELERYKVIILAKTQAIGAAEAQMLREFVQNGGVLIADVRPGIYDAHCKPLESGVLDDVFGVRRVSFDQAVIADAQINGTLGTIALDTAFPSARVDTGIEAAGAHSLGQAGETPIFFVNNFGRGTAVLLNMAMGSYPSLSAESTTAAQAEVVRALFELAQVRPAFVLLDSEGRRMRNVEITRWRNGDVEIFSLLRMQGEREAASVRFAQPQRLYDLKARRYLGQRDSYNVRITPYRAQFFAVSTRPVGDVAVELNRANVLPGGMLQARVSFPGARGRQAAYLQVTQPGGETAEWLSQVVVGDARGVTVDIPVAFNDPAGEWTVNAVELYTNNSAESRFSVRQVN